MILWLLWTVHGLEEELNSTLSARHMQEGGGQTFRSHIQLEVFF